MPADTTVSVGSAASVSSTVETQEELMSDRYQSEGFVPVRYRAKPFDVEVGQMTNDDWHNDELARWCGGERFPDPKQPPFTGMIELRMHTGLESSNVWARPGDYIVKLNQYHYVVLRHALSELFDEVVTPEG